jgi:hypothetical protein
MAVPALDQVTSFAVASIALVANSCVFDPDARCDENMELLGDATKCVCSEGYALSEGGCVKCRSHEVAGAEGCECEPGYTRSSAGRCVEQPEDVLCSG